jgi:hypothetical protein
LARAFGRPTYSSTPPSPFFAPPAGGGGGILTFGQGETLSNPMWDEAASVLFCVQEREIAILWGTAFLQATRYHVHDLVGETIVPMIITSTESEVPNLSVPHGTE